MKELEDYKWFPEFLRSEQSEFIGQMAIKTGIYFPLIKRLKSSDKLPKSLYDLCAGSGIPGQYIFEKTGCFDTLILSDKYPVSVDLNKNITYLNESADVLTMTYSKDHCYIMLNAFHHFNESEQQHILKNCEAAGAHLIVAEILEPSVLCFAKIALTGTLGVLLLTPFICKMSWKKFFFTYIIPLNCLTITIDGLISVLKSKSVNQFKKQLVGFNNIEISRLRTLAGPSIVIQLHHEH